MTPNALFIPAFPSKWDPFERARFYHIARNDRLFF